MSDGLLVIKFRPDMLLPHRCSWKDQVEKKSKAFKAVLNQIFL